MLKVVKFILILYFQLILVQYAQSELKDDTKTDKKYTEKPPVQQLVISGQPIIQATYKQQGCLDEYVIILIPMISGVSDVRFSVSEDGLKGTVRYNWPRSLCDISSLIGKELMSLENPMIIALEEELANHRLTAEQIPQATITLIFPFPVDCNEKMHKVAGLKGEDGAHILKIELPALRKTFVKSETIIKF